MSRCSRWKRWCLAAMLLASSAWIGCASSNPNRTHEGRLLDNKVTADRVHAALSKEGPEFRHVEVTGTREGITLKGSVASAETRSRAEEIAKHVDRSVALRDRLSVR